jgi:hypothetical protein
MHMISSSLKDKENKMIGFGLSRIVDPCDGHLTDPNCTLFRISLRISCLQARMG